MDIKKIVSDEEDRYDLLVIGSGPAGIHAAIQAAKLGKRVCIVEKTVGRIGGSWIHWGTLPSKTLRETLATIYSIKNHVGRAWVDRVIHDTNVRQLFQRAQVVSQQEEALVRKYLANNQISLKEGFGYLQTDSRVLVTPGEGEPYSLYGEYILIATGSRPRRPKEIPFDGWRVVDSDELLALKSIPRSMVIYGAGVIGCEYACIFQALGVDVTVVDSRTRILQYLDREVGQALQSYMEELGVTFRLGLTLTDVQFEGPEVILVAEKVKLKSDILFYAAGRVSCTYQIGLSELGIDVDDRGAIRVNECLQTSKKHIYAAGDAIGPPALAATAFQQGRQVACHAFGAEFGIFPKEFPVGVYTIPELSMVGKTEEELIDSHTDYVVGRASYKEIARGYIKGDDNGLLKILVCPHTFLILGIHIVGDDACNLVHIGQIFMMTKSPIQGLVNMVFNYPTLAEGYRIAAFNALNKIFKDGVIRAPTDLVS